MCGIIGLLYGNQESHVAQALVDALTMLQHRGQDAAGIVTSHNNRLNMRKENGTVAEVFTQENITKLRGNIGVGHVRYPTAGGSNSAEAQPLYTNAPFGMALAHNGNLTNTESLRRLMEKEHRHVNTDSDSELLLNLFADELQRRNVSAFNEDDLFDAVKLVMRKVVGAYAVIVLINRVGLVAFRDPHGIRPLCYGKRTTKTGTIDYAIASESVAIESLDYPSFRLERDVGPGEAIFIDVRGNFHSRVLKPELFAPCLFEYVYFARPDSTIDGVSVYEARAMMGEKLARKIERLYGDEVPSIDVVIPVPETSRTAALQCAHALNKPYREGFVKNRYIARTFIMPGQEARKKTVRLKLNTVRKEFNGKVVLLIDDSIVRGTTSIELIQMARDAGAKKVFFASAAPPVRFPNVYGIDIPTRQELVAHHRTEAEIEVQLGAEHVIYNDLDDVIDAVRFFNPNITAMDASCFDGGYVTGDIDEDYLTKLEAKGRGSGRKGALSSDKPPNGSQSVEVKLKLNLAGLPPYPSPRPSPYVTPRLDEESAKYRTLPPSVPGSNKDTPRSIGTGSSHSSDEDKEESPEIQQDPPFKSGSCEILHNN